MTKPAHVRSVDEQAHPDDVLVLELARGVRVEHAAAAAGMARRTAYRRLEDADFKRRVTGARARLFEQAHGRLGAFVADAVDVLAHNMRDPNVPPYVQNAAAAKIVDTAFRAREQGELVERLERLEQMLDEQAERAA